MPRVTIWIRNEDMPKWEAIADRPEWLHKMLNTPGIITGFALEDIKKGQSGAIFLTQAELAEQFNRAGGKEIITDIAVSDPVIHKQLLKAFDEPTLTEPEDTA